MKKFTLAMVFLIGMIGLTWGHTETVSIHKQTEVSINKVPDNIFVGDVMTAGVINYDYVALDSSNEMNLCQNINYYNYYNFRCQFGFNVDYTLISNLSLESVCSINADYCQLLFTKKTIRYKYSYFSKGGNYNFFNQYLKLKQI